MKISIQPEQAKKAAAEMGSVNKTFKNTNNELRAISSQISSSSSSLKSLSKSIVKEADNLETLISRLAAMEDGLERAVALYLSYEKKLTSELSSDPIHKAESSKSGNSLLDSIKEAYNDWVETGVLWNHEKADRIRRDKAMAKEISSLLKSDRFSEETWWASTENERRQILYELYYELQHIYGVTVKEFAFEKMSEAGLYADSERKLSIRESLIEGERIDYSAYKFYKPSNSYIQAVTTMAHEMRHAYQHEVVRNPQNFTVDKGTVNEWRDNFDNLKYSSIDGYYAYRHQPIEEDAWQMETLVKEYLR